MKNTDSLVDIQMCQVENLDCMRFTFTGNLSEEIAVQSINEWKNLLGDVKDAKVNMVWDCSNMSGYETPARIKWQQMLKEYKNVYKEFT